jgi:acyl-CoA reductase-like NAD-dependent aldehyde dehydrogenase
MVAGFAVGDPGDPATEIGPMAARRQQERVRGYIEDGRRAGARLVEGGTDLPEGIDRGWYVRPTLFADEHLRAGCAGLVVNRAAGPAAGGDRVAVDGHAAR